MKGFHYVILGFSVVVVAKIVKNLAAGFGVSF